VPPIVSGWQPHEPVGGSMREEQAFFRVAHSDRQPDLPVPDRLVEAGRPELDGEAGVDRGDRHRGGTGFGALVSAIEALGRLTQG
jgi:hypothetical protein